MDNQELLELIRKDRPEQVIHEVTGFKVHPLSKLCDVKYDVSVVMEVQFYETKTKRVNINLPYPVEPYKELQEKWGRESLEQSLKEINNEK